MDLKILQVNLQHSRAATANLRTTFRAGRFDIALVQEPWVYQGAVRGLSSLGADVIYNIGDPGPRACLLVKKNISYHPLTHLISRDVVAVKIHIHGGQEAVLVSAYLPHDSPQVLPRNLQLAVDNLGARDQCLIGCDANAHHTVWGSTNINKRGEDLLEQLTAKNLIVLNVGSEPTFVTSVRQEVLDLTIGTASLSSYIHEWQVMREASLSDHRYICFKLKHDGVVPPEYRNPRRTDWESYRTTLTSRIQETCKRVRTIEDLELATQQVEEAIVRSYHDNCRVSKPREARKDPWWNLDLARQKQELRRRYDTARRTTLSSDWAAYRQTLSEFKKSVRRAKRESWRSYCESIENTHAGARLHKVLSSNPQTKIGSLKIGEDQYTSNGEEALRLLVDTHFPGAVYSTANTTTPAANQTARPRHADWKLAASIITNDKLRWAVMYVVQTLQICRAGRHNSCPSTTRLRHPGAAPMRHTSRQPCLGLHPKQLAESQGCLHPKSRTHVKIRSKGLSPNQSHVFFAKDVGETDRQACPRRAALAAPTPPKTTRIPNQQIHGYRTIRLGRQVGANPQRQRGCHVHLFGR